MSLNVHVARIGIFNVDASGIRIDKNNPNTTINQLKATRQEALVISDASNINTSGYPTIREYIESESVSGYQLLYMDASFIVTGVPVSVEIPSVDVNLVGPLDVSLGSLSDGLGDAFGRLRTSIPYTMFESVFRYGDDPYKWNHTITNNSGSAAVTHLSNESSMSLTLGTTNGDSIIRESKRVANYQPGKSLLILNTFKMATPIANLRQRVGYFGANDGIYFMAEGTNLYFVIRKSTSGSANDTDEKILQSNWNMDTLDGSNGTSNPSGIELDLASTQIMYIDIEWLGVGTVRIGFIIDGEYICCHKFHHANNGFDKVYMKTSTLPIRYEITNYGTTAQSSTLRQICSTVMSEAGFEDRSKPFSISGSLAGAPISQTAYTPLVSIRLKNANLDAVVVPTFLEVYGLTNAAYKWALIYGSALTNAVWVDAGSTSSVEYDISASAMTYSNGRVVLEGFFVGSAKGGAASIGGGDLAFALQIGRTIGGTSDIITLAALATTNNDKAVGSLSWAEHV